MIVGFATPKGGAGKSTSCLALAGAAIERNSDIPVTLIDLDSQRAMERFCEKRAYNNLPAFNVSCKYMAECSDYRSIHELALSENEKGGLVLLDLPGHASDFNLLSAAIADIVVIPSALNTDEIYLGMNYLYMLMDYAQNSEWRLSSSFLLNRIPSVQSAASKSIRESLIELEVSMFKTEFPYLQIASDIVGTGQFPFELAKRETSVKSSEKLRSLSMDFLSEVYDLYTNGTTWREK